MAPFPLTGVLDSGFGGLSVAAEILKRRPHWPILYHGDFANAPYGGKSAEEVDRLTHRAAERLLAAGDLQALVLACNTATSASVATLRADLPIPVIGMEPAVKPALAAHPEGRVLVMATALTLREKKFRDLLDRIQGEGRIVPMPCPGLAGAVDTGDLDHAGDLARDLLDGFDGARLADAVVLGCSHYAFVAPAIRDWFGRPIALFDGAEGTARRLIQVVEERYGSCAPDSASDAGPAATGDEALSVDADGAPPMAPAIRLVGAPDHFPDLAMTLFRRLMDRVVAPAGTSQDYAP